MTMTQQIIENKTDQDSEYKKAVREFYRVYNALRKKRALSMHGHSDLKGAQMKIWEYRNDGAVSIVCNINTDNSETCYKAAAQQLKGYKKIFNIR